MAGTQAKDSRPTQKFSVLPMRNPSDLRPDAQLRAQIVLHIMEECIQKFKISLLMPMIFDKSMTISNLLADTKYEKCAKLLKEFLTNYKLGFLKTPNKCETNLYYDQQLAQVIDAFQENYEILELIEKPLDADIDQFACFLSTLQTLYEIAKQRFYREARAELLLEKRLHLFYFQNKYIKSDIQKFQQKIMRSKNALRWRIAAKEGLVARIEEELDEDRENHEMIFHIEEKEANKKFHKAQISTQHRQKELEEEVERCGDSLAKTYKYNFMTEQDVRSERNKLLIQLQTLTKKYDTVLGEKFKQNMILDKQVAELQEEFDEFFKTIYEKAEKEYTDIINAIERKKRKEFETKLALFVGNRAAKIIQRAWKEYMKIVREERGETVKKPKKKK